MDGLRTAALDRHLRALVRGGLLRQPLVLLGEAMAKRGRPVAGQICSPFIRKNGEWKEEACSVSTTLATSRPPEAPRASASA